MFSVRQQYQSETVLPTASLDEIHRRIHVVSAMHFRHMNYV